MRHEGGLERCVPVGSTSSAAHFLAPGDSCSHPALEGEASHCKGLWQGVVRNLIGPEAYQMWLSLGE